MVIMRLFLLLLWCATCILAGSNHFTPRVVIVGSGPAGIAASSKLLENGFTDVKILEAENRIGGRVHSIKFGDYIVDLGGEWVHGEKDNVVFELAWPLGLLEKAEGNYNMSIKFFGSSGLSLSSEMSFDIKSYTDSIEQQLSDVDSLITGSYGEYAEAKFEEYFKAHPEISKDLYTPISYMMNLGQMGLEGANSWHLVSARAMRDYAVCNGDQNMNWKNRTYSTILDILMKKYPNPDEELPVLNNTHTNSRVTKIDYKDNTIPIKLSTADGKEYLADHVIFTASLGVLKENHEQLFDPPLPEKKITAIQNLGFGHVAKIFLYYENPWWNTFSAHAIFWTAADKNEIEENPEKSWMLGIFSIFPIEHKPKVLCIWMSSDYSVKMESISDELLHNQTFGLLKRFLGNEYDITEPTLITRTKWNTNENFRGTYSYHGIDADTANISHVDLAMPLIRDDKPILQFAGEATSDHYATVNGAVDSGWREADRLINLYSK